MNRLAIAAAALASTLIACSGDGDIGIDEQPVTCNPDQQSTARLEGTLTSQYNGQGEVGPGGAEYEFGEITDINLSKNSQTGAPTTLRIGDGTTHLQIFFACGAPTRDVHDVHAGQQDGEVVPCPLKVTSFAGGQLEYLPAEDGKLVIDENETCLAGRFSIDFGDHGRASGTFSVPN